MNKNCIITIDNKVYALSIPNVGQLMEIESMKMSLSNGQYGAMARANTKASVFTLDLIDAFATFRALIPTLNLGSFLDLSPEKSKTIVKEYRSKWLPFIQEEEKKWYENDEDPLTQEERGDLKND